MIFHIAFVLRKSKMKGYGISQCLRVLFSLLSNLIHFKPICQLCSFGNFSVFMHKDERYLVCSKYPLYVREGRARVIAENKLRTVEGKEWKIEDIKLNFSNCFKISEKGKQLHVAPQFPAFRAARNQYAGSHDRNHSSLKCEAAPAVRGHGNLNRDWPNQTPCLCQTVLGPLISCCCNELGHLFIILPWGSQMVLRILKNFENSAAGMECHMLCWNVWGRLVDKNSLVAKTRDLLGFHNWTGCSVSTLTPHPGVIFLTQRPALNL